MVINLIISKISTLFDFISIFKFILSTDLTRASLIRKVCQELKIDIESEGNAETTENVLTNNIESTAKSKNKSQLIESLLQAHCPGAVRFRHNLEYELQIFREAPSYMDVIEFWKKHHKTFPKLAAVAKVVLALPLTTSKSEGSFSVAGCVVRSRRASITPMRVEKVLFIHDNFHLFES